MNRIDCKIIPWAGDPFSFYRAFSAPMPGILLESARTSARTGRYSIVAKDPFLILCHENGRLFLKHPRTGKVQKKSGNPFAVLRRLLKKYSVPAEPGRPPFSAGAVGYAGYECKNWIEASTCRAGRRAGSLAKPAVLPELYFLFFDRCVVWDHEKKEVFLCVFRHGGRKNPLLGTFERSVRKAVKQKQRPRPFVFQTPMELESSWTRPEFHRAVNKTKRYIRRGEIFQANLAQRFSFPFKKKSHEIYSRLRQINPSPFFGILDAEDFSIVSGSPERLLKLEGKKLETRPIAGTRWRGKNEKEDSRLALELLLSDKERAEHIMLVDLERNDLGRVAEYGSVIVDELMALEDYSHVKHIVSNLQGALREGLDAIDAFCAFFPGGTITGAPKVRCMQIIDELEPVARGPYTGSLGYFSFTGNMDFNILIRSLVMRDQKAYLHVGSGIVADSQPKKEYHETLYKAQALLSAVFGEKQVRSFFRRSGLVT